MMLLNIITLGLVGVTCWQARLLRREIILKQRPRLRVHTVIVRQPKPIHAPQPDLFANGHLVSGQFYVNNIGGTFATIIEYICKVIWTKKPLPMERPYEGETGIRVKVKLNPGQSCPVTFQSETPIGNEGDLIRNGKDGWNLYVMGWILYIDNLRIERQMNFCRQYRWPEGRFFAIDDYDYEHEE